METKIVFMSTPYGSSHDWLKKYFTQPRVSFDMETNMDKFNWRKAGMRTPFRGTRTVWIAGDNRKINVVDLDTPHLANIIEYLRERAKEELFPICIDFRGPTVNDIEGWLFENCITYPALREEAKRRGIWDEEKIYIGPKQTLAYIKTSKRLSLDDKFKLLTDLVEEVLSAK